jgi:serine/threonine kinase 4/serine/threonine kinase 3
MVVRADSGSSIPGTMVYAGGTTIAGNGDDDSTMHRNVQDLGSYKPAFLAHFEGAGGAANEPGSSSSRTGGDGAALDGDDLEPLTVVEADLSLEQLQERLKLLDLEQAQELDELRRLYQAKREPIQRALDSKHAVPTN